MIVRMFQSRFAALVEAGQKCQTIRPVPRRPIKKGDSLSLRAWTGKPYRSKQRLLRNVTITRVAEVLLSEQRITIDGAAFENRQLGAEWMNSFARRDGFESWKELASWFEQTHGLPFTGILIEWSAP